jgi:hypothetical protein
VSQQPSAAAPPRQIVPRMGSCMRTCRDPTRVFALGVDAGAAAMGWAMHSEACRTKTLGGIFKQSHNKPTQQTNTQTNKQTQPTRGQRWSRFAFLSAVRRHGMARHGRQRPAMLRRTNKRGRNWAGQLVVKDTVEGSGADNEMMLQEFVEAILRLAHAQVRRQTEVDRSYHPTIPSYPHPNRRAPRIRAASSSHDDHSSQTRGLRCGSTRLCLYQRTARTTESPLSQPAMRRARVGTFDPLLAWWLRSCRTACLACIPALCPPQTLAPAPPPSRAAWRSTSM